MLEDCLWIRIILFDREEEEESDEEIIDLAKDDKSDYIDGA